MVGETPKKVEGGRETEGGGGGIPSTLLREASCYHSDLSLLLAETFHSHFPPFTDESS